MSREFIESARICLVNAHRLLGDAQCLEFQKPPATKYYLSIIAQEECAKGFLLYLVAINVIPWHPLVLRATRDHRCKQLLGIVIDFLSPGIDTFLERMKNTREFPAKVSDAIEILRYEKIGRWHSSTWIWADDPEYDKDAFLVYEGKRDEEKQRSLYVQLSKSGQALATPLSVMDGDAENEYDMAKRSHRFLEELTNNSNFRSSDYERVENTFRALFSKLP
jgi:AbiV family abortive infection protein